MESGMCNLTALCVFWTEMLGFFVVSGPSGDPSLGRLVLHWVVDAIWLSIENGAGGVRNESDCRRNSF